jgi:hypothetical protein
MPSPSLRRWTLVFLLAAALAMSSWASAAGSKAPASPRATTAVHQDLLSRAWNLLASLWGEEGCHIDPDGRCASVAAQPVPPRVHTDEGCNLDPNGRCEAGAAQPVPPRVHTDTGCHIDPNGRCAS